MVFYSYQGRATAFPLPQYGNICSRQLYPRTQKCPGLYKNSSECGVYNDIGRIPYQ